VKLLALHFATQQIADVVDRTSAIAAVIRAARGAVIFDHPYNDRNARRSRETNMPSIGSCMRAQSVECRLRRYVFVNGVRRQLGEAASCATPTGSPHDEHLAGPLG
jgi:hypothetical protein